MALVCFPMGIHASARRSQIQYTLDIHDIANLYNGVWFSSKISLYLGYMDVHLVCGLASVYGNCTL